MVNNMPKQFLQTSNFHPSKPDFKDTYWKNKITDKQLCTLKIYVTERDYFIAKFPNIFNNDDYIIDFTTDKDDKRWDKNPIKFWECQVNFAISCVVFLDIICSIKIYQIW